MDKDKKTVIIVPCRLASTRFPEKLLHEVRGKSLILHVAERISREVPEIPMVFAVDDPRLEQAVKKGGFNAVMTSADHQSGTDRLAEANRQVGADIVINIQGDEPLVTADQIQRLDALIRDGAPMSTLATPFVEGDDFLDPNQVKVVLGMEAQALYFSRSPIPYMRDQQGMPDADQLAHHLCYRHLGMYAYTGEFLEQFSNMPAGRLEQLEKLEQLRVLEHGFRISVGITSDPSIGIDTEEDARKFSEYLESEG